MVNLVKSPKICIIDAKEVYLEQNCHCAMIQDFEAFGPFCARWVSDRPPFCMLNGSNEAKYCPGAVLVESRGVYYTHDEGVCNKTSCK